MYPYRKKIRIRYEKLFNGDTWAISFLFPVEVIKIIEDVVIHAQTIIESW